MLSISQFLVISLVTLLASCADITFVYRADSRPWNQIMADGGFKTKAATNNLKPDFRLYKHVKPDGEETARNDGFISTSWDPRVCRDKFIRKGSLSQGTAYLYKISAFDKMVDVQSILRQYYPFPGEKEYAATGTIPWRFVSEWTIYKNGKIISGPTRNRDFDTTTIHWNPNKLPQYQIAGFPADHPAWSKEPWKSYKKYIPKKRDTLGGRKDLVHFVQVRADKVAPKEEDI